MLSCFSHVWLFVTLWTVALQASLSMGLCRQEYWSGLPCPPPGDLPNQGIEHGLPHCRSSALYHLSHQGSPKQENKQKLAKNLTLFKAHTNHWTNLRTAETKRKKEFNLLQGKNSTFLETWEKETSNTITWKKMKRQTNTAQMKKQPRKT